MDELALLRDFRAGSVASDENARARTLFALRAAIEAERPRMVRPRPGHVVGASRRRGLRLVLAVGAALLVAAGLVVAWPFGGSSSVLSNAAAAIGDRPVTHVVVKFGIGDALIDLRTGRRSPVEGRTQIWYDQRRGVLSISSFRGQPAGTFLVRNSAAQGQHDVIKAFAANYKIQLRSGAFHITGSGVVSGTPVYWLASKPNRFVTYSNANANPINGIIHRRVEQVAIAKTTYKPILIREELDGRVEAGTTIRITKIETIAAQPNLFARARTSPYAPISGAGASITQTTLAQARAEMHRAPFLPAASIGALRRSFVGETGYFTSLNSYADQLPGVAFYYGNLAPTRLYPPYRAPYVSITEFPNQNAYVRQAPGYFPSNDQAVLERNTLTLHTHGLYIVVNASKPQLAIQAARTLVKR
jgi:hypothetical protein